MLSLVDYNWKIGAKAPLAIIAGVNVLEDERLSLDIGIHLKKICTRLDMPFMFKASYDKANRSSIQSYRGPGLEKGIEILANVKEKLDVPICSDVHEPGQAAQVAHVVDLLQIPAFLCRQTDLVVDVARVAEMHNKLIHVKKAQFLAPWDCQNIISKIGEITKTPRVVMCERGVSFGYNNLTVDMLSIGEMQKYGTPVTIDATHAVQLPGADPRTKGASTGGRREGVATIARAAVAAGADGVFLEFHHDPDKALCDGPSCLPITAAAPLLEELQQIHAIIRGKQGA